MNTFLQARKLLFVFVQVIGTKYGKEKHKTFRPASDVPFGSAGEAFKLKQTSPSSQRLQESALYTVGDLQQLLLDFLRTCRNCRISVIRELSDLGLLCQIDARRASIVGTMWTIRCDSGDEDYSDEKEINI